MVLGVGRGVKKRGGGDKKKLYLAVVAKNNITGILP